MLAAIRNKGGASSLKKNSSLSPPKSSAEESGSPLLSAIRNKGGATGLKKKSPSAVRRVVTRCLLPYEIKVVLVV